MKDATQTPAGAKQAPAAIGASPVPKDSRTPTAVQLSDGRVAVMRPAKGADLERAAAIAGRGNAGNSMSLMMAVAAQTTTIDGQGIVYEDLAEWPIGDVFELIGAIMGNGPALSQL